MTAKDLIGKSVSFDHPEAVKVGLAKACPRLVGVITEAQEAGFAEPGHIPDFVVTVRGGSGKTITTSFVNSYMKVFQP